MSYDFITTYTDIFCGKNEKSFLHFFNRKYWHIFYINICKFNETLTNNFINFEQPDQTVCLSIKHFTKLEGGLGGGGGVPFRG